MLSLINSIEILNKLNGEPIFNVDHDRLINQSSYKLVVREINKTSKGN